MESGKEIGSQAIHSLVPNRCGRLGKLEDESEAMVLSLYSRVAHVYWYTRDKYWTLWAHLRGLNLAENYEPTDHLAQCYSGTCAGNDAVALKSADLNMRKNLPNPAESQRHLGTGAITELSEHLSLFVLSV